MIWPFKRKEPEVETRASGSGFTAEIMHARDAYISGQRGIAELTGVVQACISLWEAGLSSADVEGTVFLDKRTLGMIARALALRGDAVFLLREDGLIPASDWDLKTRHGKPTAYRLSISEAGGGYTETALAAEVLHFRAGCDVSAPYYGTAPLKRAQISAGLLNSLETALGEVFENAPLGSQVVSYPESKATDMTGLARGLRGRRGHVILQESVNTVAAGGPVPQSDWKPSTLSPDLEKAMAVESLTEAKGAIAGVFGVLPALFSPATTGPLVREAQRHLAQWCLQPLADMIAEEATDKLASPIRLDVMRPTQAYDAGGRARALTAIVQALAQAKETGVDGDTAMKLVNWSEK